MSKILIVEDEKKIARFVELELRHEGYAVLVAEDGRTGLDMALSPDVDLVILDLMLPEMSGIIGGRCPMSVSIRIGTPNSSRASVTARM